MVTSTLLPIVLFGGELVGIWDSSGNPISALQSAAKPQYFRVLLPECAKGQTKVKLTLKRGGKVKHYVVECSPEVFLEWDRTKPHKEYRKTLIRREKLKN